MCVYVNQLVKTTGVKFCLILKLSNCRIGRMGKRVHWKQPHRLHSTNCGNIRNICIFFYFNSFSVSPWVPYINYEKSKNKKATHPKRMPVRLPVQLVRLIPEIFFWVEIHKFFHFKIHGARGMSASMFCILAYSSHFPEVTFFFRGELIRPVYNMSYGSLIKTWRNLIDEFKFQWTGMDNRLICWPVC